VNLSKKEKIIFGLRAHQKKYVTHHKKEVKAKTKKHHKCLFLLSMTSIVTEKVKWPFVNGGNW